MVCAVSALVIYLSFCIVTKIFVCFILDLLVLNKKILHIVRTFPGRITINMNIVSFIKLQNINSFQGLQFVLCALIVFKNVILILFSRIEQECLFILPSRIILVNIQFKCDCYVIQNLVNFRREDKLCLLYNPQSESLIHEIGMLEAWSNMANFTFFPVLLQLQSCLWGHLSYSSHIAGETWLQQPLQPKLWCLKF